MRRDGAAGGAVLLPRGHPAPVPQGGLLSEMEWVWALVLLAALGGGSAERDCRVSSFRVKENFDKARVGISPGPPILAGRQWNLNSSPQLSHLFLSSLGYGTPSPKRTPRVSFCKTTSSLSFPWTRRVI